MRPKHTKKDANHWIPRDYLRDRCGGFEVIQFDNGPRCYTANFRGMRYFLFDTADFGGVWADWFLICDSRSWCVLEVKTPEAYDSKDYGMTEGEKWLNLNLRNFEIVVTDLDVEKVLLKMMVS